MTVKELIKLYSKGKELNKIAESLSIMVSDPKSDKASFSWERYELDKALNVKVLDSVNVTGFSIQGIDGESKPTLNILISPEDVYKIIIHDIDSEIMELEKEKEKYNSLLWRTSLSKTEKV